MTPVKEQKTPTSKLAGQSKTSENANPNNALPTSTAPLKTKSKRPVPGIAHRGAPVAMQGRKFLVAKKSSKKEGTSPSMAPLAPLDGCCNCKDKQIGMNKCRCVAYESLRASQEEFFKSRAMAGDEGGKEIDKTEEEGDGMVQSESDEVEDSELSPHITSSRIRKIKNRLMEDARSSIPEFGFGRVKHLRNAFERLLSIRKSGGEDDEEKDKLGFKWALPGMQGKDQESTDLSSSTDSLPPPDFVFTAKPTVSSSFDSSKSSRSYGGGGSLRLSSLSGRIGGRRCKKIPRATIQQPFNLRTEQRGACKKEEFQKKVEEQLMEEERQRVPIAQGLPWTTDEAECLVKPPVKESTTPLEFQLHSDVRAVERADFDEQVAENLSLIEKYRLEREREQKLQEEEEIRRLRKALVPKAQPMPYFDRPFIPKRSIKLPTIPKEPKFHGTRILNHKKAKCSSWSEMDFVAPTRSTLT